MSTAMSTVASITPYATIPVTTAPVVPLAARPGEPLRFDCPVPRAGVHKAAAGEVLLTDARSLGSDRFAVAASWPRNHLLGHRPASRTSDPLLLVETTRQAAILLCHTFFDVPQGSPFVMQSIDFSIDDPQLPGGGRPALPTMLDATCVRTVTGQRWRFAMEAVLIVDGRRCGRIGVTWEVMTPTRYATLRRRAATAAASAAAGPASAVVPNALPALPSVAARGPRPVPADAGNERDTLLGTDPLLPEGSWLLRMDQTHPVLFDHPSDHIPGTVLLEAFRQATMSTLADAAAGRGRTLTGGRVAFHCFGELDPPVTITAQAEEPAAEFDAVRVSAVQGGRVLASGVLLGSGVR